MEKLLGRGLSPNMNELCHPEEGGEEVKATLDPMINGYSICLSLGVASQTGGVTMTLVTRVGVCSTGEHRTP